jgi:mRNA-degrading endonuclease toxin of MazEF toxin-antitoxin module
VVVTAQRTLNAESSVVQVVPPTTMLRGFYPEVAIGPDGHNGLEVQSAAPCQDLRTVSPGRVGAARGYVRLATLSRVRQTIALIVDP